MIHRSKNTFLTTTPIRKLLALFIGISHTLTYYFLFQLSREIFRFYSITSYQTTWNFSFHEIAFYNFIFAFIALLFGQSAAIAFYFSGPRKYGEKKYYRRIDLIHDQRGLSYFFLLWFSELSLCYGIWFGMTNQDNQLFFSLFPQYSYIFFLIVLVIFLQSWKTMRLIYRKHSLKWMLITFLCLSFLAFVISKIHLINSDEWDKMEKMKSTQIVPKGIPINDNNFRVPSRKIKQTFHLVDSSIFTINMNKNMLNKKDFEQSIKNFENSIVDDRNSMNKYYNLQIDSSAAMKHVLEIHQIIADHSKNRSVVYAFRTTQKTFSTDFGIYNRIIDLRFLEKNKDKFENNITISLDQTGQLFIDSTLINIDQLKAKMLEEYENHNKCLINFHFSNHVDFIHYFNVRIELKMIMAQLRSRSSFRIFNKAYQNLDREEIKKLRDHLNIGFIEIPNIKD